MAFMKGSQRANESFQSATQFEKVNRPQSGRKHPLDIAQVVKVAACSYLELDPQETDYIHGYKNQASDPDGLGPVEVHLHHHHHHFYKDQIKSNEYISNAGDFELETGYSMPHFNPCLQGLWNGYGNANDGTHINPEVVWPSDGAEAFAPSGMSNVTEINLGNTQAEDHYAQRDSQTFHHQAGLYQPSLTSTHQPNLDKGFSQVSYISSSCVGNLSESSHRSVEHPGSILSSDTGGWTAEGRLNLQEEPQDGANIVKKGIICENNSRPSSRTGGAALSRRRKNIMEDAACNGVLPQLGLNLETPRNCQPLESIEQVSGDRCPSRHVSCGVRLDGHGRKKEAARSEETNCVLQPSSEFHQETQRESFMSFDGTDGRERGKLNLLDQKKSWSSEAPTEEKTCIFVDNTKTAENLRSPTDEGFLFPATFTDALDPRMSVRHGSHSDICKENLSYWNLEDNSVTSREQVKKQYMIKKESRPSRSSTILNKKKDHEGMDVGTFEVSEVNDCYLDAVSNNREVYSSYQEKDSEKDHLKRQLSTALDDSKCLRISLETAKRQIKEEENDNNQLKEQLEEKSNELAVVVEKHADELQKNKKFLEEVQQLNQITESEKATSALKFLDLKSHYEKLIETLESQVKEARDDVESLREMTNELKQEISNHEVKASILEKNLAEKVNEMQELKMHIEDLQNEKQRITLEKVNEVQELKNYIQDLQNEKENMTLENFELMSKQQEAKHEAMQHARYVADYLSINEELLAFAQRKDDEVTYLKNQVASFQNIICEKTEVNSCLENALQDLRKQMDDVRERSILLEHHYEVTKTKFANIEKELTEREESLEKITRHLAGSVENQDSLLAEAEQLRRKLQDAMYKEFQLENELMQSREVIDDLKQKVCQMENEMLKIRVEMGEIGKQNSMLKRATEAKEQDFIALQNETADLQQKVQDLEEEVMEKEGQIAILKGSFPEEFGLGF